MKTVKNTPNMSLHQLLEHQATITPERIALADLSGYTLSYASLTHGVDLWARILSIEGVVKMGQKTPVFITKTSCIYQRPSDDATAERDTINGGLYTIMLAIMRAGGVMIPVDPTYPVERIHSMLSQLKDLGPVLTTSDLAPRLPSGTDFVAVDTLRISQMLSASTLAEEFPEVNGEDPAYVIFTSGTTGIPKGILVPHRAVSQCAIAQYDFLGLAGEDDHRILQVSNYVFDAVFWDMFVAFAHGYCLCVAEQRIIFSDLPRVVEQLKISIIHTTPTVIQNVLMPGRTEHDISSLRIMCVGGERMKSHVQVAWQDRVRLFNCYGPSEYYICMGKRMHEEIATNNIGQPFGKNRAYVLEERPDGSLAKVTIGEEGELYLAGPQIAFGYINDGKANSRSFLGDPFVHGERMYKTGDRVVRAENGDIQFCGRQDGQIKLRGIRIEVDEIERVIQAHSLVNGVAVDKVTLQGDQDQLCAFLVFSPAAVNASTAAPGEVRVQKPKDVLESASILGEFCADLAKRLPPAMTPSLWIPITALPFNVSGKLDRAYLHALLSTMSSDDVRAISRRLISGSVGNDDLEGLKNVMPWTRTQELLRSCWAKALALKEPDIGLDDVFHRLGGDSITAIRLSALVRRQGFQLRSAAALSKPTIRLQAEILDKEHTSEQERLSAEEKVQQVLPYGIVRLSPVQTRYFEYADFDIPEVDFFNQSMMLQIAKPYPSDKIHQALQAITRAHPVLRSVFKKDGTGQWVSDIPAEAEKSKSHVLFEDLGFVNDPSTISSHIDKLSKSLDPRIGLNVGACTFMTQQVGAAQYAVFLTINHWVVDLVSWRIILDELETALYGDRITGEEDSMSFRGWMEDQWKEAQQLTAANWTLPLPRPENIWKISPVDQPLLYSTFKTAVAIISRKTTDIFLADEIHVAFNTEPLDILLAAVGIALAQSSGLSAVAVALEGHGREPKDPSTNLTSTVGWFTSVFPVVLNTDPFITPELAVSRVKDIRRSIPRNGLLYGMMRYLAESVREGQSYLNVPISFNYRGRFQQLENRDALFSEYRPDGVSWCDFGHNVASPGSLHIEVLHHGGQLEVRFEYSPQVYSIDETTRLSTNWKTAFEGIVAHLAVVGKGRGAIGSQLTLADVPLLRIDAQTFETLSGSFEARTGRPWSQVENVYPCTPMQTSMLALTLSDNNFFMTQLIFHLNEGTREDRLHSAFAKLLRRNETLRTLFLMVDIPGLQPILNAVIKPAFAVPSWRVIDVSIAELSGAMDNYLENDRAVGFPLNKCSLRCAIFNVEGAPSRMVLTLHHAQFDGWSYPLILEDLGYLYRNETHRLSPSVPYAKYVEWLQQQDYTPALEYWSKKLDGATILDFPRVSADNALMVKSSKLLNREWTGDLGLFCKQHGVTAASVVRVALAVVLGRICGVDDILYEFASSGRSAHQFSGIEDVRGTCITAVPSRVLLSPESTCIDVIRQVMQDHDNETAHEWVGLKEILERHVLHSERQFAQVFLAFQNYVDGNVAGASADLINYAELPVSAQNSALTLFVFPRGDNALLIDCEYDPRFVTESEATWVVTHLCNAISAIISLPESLTRDIDLTTPEQKQLVLHQFIGPQPVEFIAMTLHGLFEAQVLCTPDKVAIETEVGEVITYRALNTCADALAGMLRSRIPDIDGQVIGLLIDRSINAIIAMFAILKAGGAFAPLDPLSPPERNSGMLDDLGLSALVTVHGLEAMCPTADNVIKIYVDEPLDEAPDLTSNLPSVSADMPAYVMHTSGSTGKPKAIICEHKHVVTYFSNVFLALPLDETTRYLSIARFTNDACIEEIFRPLTTGGTVCLPTDLQAWAQLSMHLRYLQATHILITPTVLSLLGLPDFPTLKTVTLIGESSSKDLRALWTNQLQLYEMYGPTESTVLVTVKRWQPDDLEDAHLGVPFGHNRIYILDKLCRPCPPYCIGEIYIAGSQISRGYINVAVDNAFVEDPFLPGQRMYRTGDFARWTPSGIVFLGRKDGQTKINGIRIELEAVEQDIRKGFPITELELVVDRVKDDTSTKLVVVLSKTRTVLKHNEDIVPLLSAVVNLHWRSQIAEFARTLSASLPPHMVPSFWLIVESIPMTTTNKTHRGRLRNFLEKRGLTWLEDCSRDLLSVSTNAGEHSGLPSHTEMAIAEAWINVLPQCSRDDISLQATWWSYGGDSISAMRLALYLRERGFHLQMVDLLRNSTIKAQATREDELALQDALVLKTSPSQDLGCSHLSGTLTPPYLSSTMTNDRNPSSRDDISDLDNNLDKTALSRWNVVSLSQERLWFLDQLYPNALAYSMPSALLIEGPLDRLALRASLDALVQRHQTLRTIFRNHDGRPYSRVLKMGSSTLSETPLPTEGFDVDTLDRLAMGIMREMCKIPFFLEDQPGWRCHLITVTATRHWLFLNMHHIIADGWSWGIILKELIATYAAPRGKVHDVLPPLHLQFDVFARLQQDAYESGALNAQLSGLVKHLEGYTPAEFPTDQIRPPLLTFEGKMHTFFISTNTLEGLERFSKRSSATLYMILLAAFRVLHYRYTGVEDAVIGSPIAGRTVPGTEDLIGFFVNTLVVRIPIDGKATLGQAVEETRSAALTAYEFSEVPFLKLVSEMQPKRDLSRNPIIQLVLALQLDQTHEFTTNGVKFSRRDVHITTRVDIELHFRKIEGRLKCDIIYSASLFHDDTIISLAENLIDILQAMVQDPELVVDEVPFSQAADHLEHMHVPLHIVPSAPFSDSIVHRFKEIVAVFSDHTALIDGTTSISYHTLDRLSDALSCLISRTLDARDPPEFIALCIPPSALAIIAIISILKSGSAYLPLDVRLPESRLQDMLSDSGTSLLLVTSESPQLSLSTDIRKLDVTHFLLDWEIYSSPPRTSSDVSASDLAYLLYTSGSTGTPKGVAVSQRSVLALISNTDPLSFGPNYRIAQTTNLAFDPSVIEIWGALLSGAILVCFTRYDVLEPSTLAQQFNSYKIDFCIMSGALFRQMLSLGPELFRSLHTLMLGGESVQYESLQLVYDINPNITIRNAYGPTEATVLTTCYTIASRSDALQSGQVPIGIPIATATALVLDPRRRLVPPSVIGELFIGGEGVSAGYHHRPVETASSFVNLSLEALGHQSSRFYRTGDIVRWRTDGKLEFIGRRSTGQVKIRGQRLELGEVEAALVQTGLVKDAAVIVHKPIDGDPCLVAYVVASRDVVGAASLADPREIGGTAIVENWRDVYDDVYGSYDMNLARSDFLGWDSMITSSPIPKREMEAWMQDTLKPFFARRPRNVFEVGCGVGIFLYEMEPKVEKMWAIEPSFEAVGHLNVQLKADGLEEKVSIWCSTADSISTLPYFRPDFILLNSVSQYFPSGQYLQDVVFQMVERCGDEGVILLGDIRSLPLDELLGIDIILHEWRAEMNAHTIQELRDRLQTRKKYSAELLVDPTFFLRLQALNPDITHVEILPKTFAAINELSQFRYQVLLHIRHSISNIVPDIWHHHDEVVNHQSSLHQIIRAFSCSSDDILAIECIPNRMLTWEHRAINYIFSTDTNGAADLTTLPSTQVHTDVETTAWELEQLAGQFGLSVQLSFARQSETTTLDAVFMKQPAINPFVIFKSCYKPGISISSLCSKPAQTVPDRKGQNLEKELLDRLHVILPSFMIPHSIRPIESLPLTTNGKLDRRQLEARAVDDMRIDLFTIVESTNEATDDGVENIICKIFEELLPRHSINRHSDFFTSGGHSLLATRLKSRLEQTFPMTFTLQDIFSASTPMDLARRVKTINSLVTEPKMTASCITVGRREEFRPLSFAQERLWFLDQLYPGNRMYHVPLVYKLVGALDRSIMLTTLGEIIQRHEILRSVFVSIDGIPKQRVLTSAPPTEIKDLTLEREKSHTVDKLLSTFLYRPFDLDSQPAFRSLLLILDDCTVMLVISMHHIVTDGWSIDLLRKELVDIYSARVLGVQHTLLEPTLQYSDFAEWQRTAYFEHILRHEAEYWKHQLADSKAAEFPADRPRPSHLSEHANVYEIVCNKSLEERLSAICNSTNTTMFMLLLAAFRVLHYRLTGDEDASFGVPIANRHRPEIENIIGFFTNTQVYRIKVTPGQTFLDLLSYVRELSLAAFENQDMPFERIVSLVQPVRDTSRNPLVQTLLAYQTVDYEPFSFSGIDASILDTEHRTRLDLQVHFSSTTEGLKGLFIYSTDLFDPTTIEHYASAMQYILEDVARDSSTIVDLVHLGPPNLLYPRSDVYPLESIVSLFRAAAVMHSAVVALRQAEQEWTYEQLDCYTSSIARVLLQRYSHSFHSEQPNAVGIFIDNSAWTVIAMLSVLKAGWAYIPIDIRLPENRVYTMLSEARSTLVLLSLEYSPATPFAGVDCFYIDRMSEQEYREQAAVNLPERMSEDIACIVFTSGTTGIPKGIMIPHRSIVRVIFDDNLLPLVPGSCMAQISNLGFDPSGLEIWGSLCRGATLVSYRYLEILDVPGLALKFERDGVNSAHFPTPTFAYALEHVPTLLRRLSLILVGGEAMTKHHIEVFDRMATSATLINAYGPAENGIVSTFYRHGPNMVIPRSVPVGIPVIGTYVVIVDEGLSPVPEGVVGEICVLGAGLAKGYIRPPITDPFVSMEICHKLNQVYRTGDMGRIWHNQLEYIGRRDTQIKLRGQRIEIGEIESAILRIGICTEVAVVLQKNEQDDGQLVAYVTPKDTGSNIMLSDRVIKSLSSSLPRFMIPAAIHTVALLPRSGTGKIDRKLLSSYRFHPSDRHANLAAVPEEAETPIQTVVLDVYAKILQIDRSRVQLDDSFFDLGGHSLLLVRLATSLQAADEKTQHATLQLVFENPSPRLLSNRLSELSGTHTALSPPMENVRLKNPGRRIYPASGIMWRFWTLQALFADTTYSLPSCRRTNGLNLDILGQEFTLMCRENVIFRTNLRMSSTEELQQVIYHQPDLHARIMDLSHIPDALAHIQKTILDDISTPFDLSSDPLIRLMCFELGGSQIIHLNMHHCISDHDSNNLFWKILLDRTEKRMRAIEWEDDDITDRPQYVDFTVDQIARLQNRLTRKAIIDYWHQQLAAIEPLQLPSLSSLTPFGHTNHMQEYTTVFELPSTFETLCAQLGATAFAGFLSIVQALFRRYTLTDTFGILIPMSLRNRVETQDMFGCFLETVIFRNQASLGKTFTQLLADTMHATASAMQYVDMPFEEVVAVCGLKQTYFPVMFVYMNDLEASDQYDLPFPHPSPPAAAKFPLTIVITRRGADVLCTVNFDSGAIASDFAKGISGHMEMLIHDITHNLGKPTSKVLGMYNILPDNERTTIECALNGGGEHTDEHLTVNHLLQNGFMQAQDKIALNFEGNSYVTYAELYDKVGIVAASLRDIGLAVGDVVAILMQPCIDRIIAILAVVRMGAAYVPLDPYHPSERLSFIINDSSSKYVITSSDTHMILPLAQISCVTVIEFRSLQDAECDGILGDDDLHPEDLCYILYTSGSTGLPKGVQVEHKSLVNSIKAHTEVYELDAASNLLQFAPYTFDVSVMDIFATLSVGGTLCLGSKDFLLADLANAIREMKISHIATTPTVISLISPEQVPTLEVLAIGGEPMTQMVVDTWAAKRKLKNVYGPTECTVNVISRRVSPDTSIHSIGKPLKGVRARILDEYMQQVPAGVIGQLAIAGPQVSRGYLDDAQTSKSFVWQDSIGDRIYLTGDLARLDRSGNIDCLGRVDNQIKIRGLRVELGEIEDKLASHEKIKSCAIILVKTRRGNDVLVAFMSQTSEIVLPQDLMSQPTPPERLDIPTDFNDFIADVRAHLMCSLPDYFVPTYWIPMSRLPTNVNGKIDRRALESLFSNVENSELWKFSGANTQVNNDHLSDKTRSWAEEALVQIWSQILGLEKDSISSDISFFSLGGDSISAIRMATKARQQGLKINPKDIYNYPTLRVLAANMQTGDLTAADSLLQHDEPVGLFPLTPIMKWFINDRADVSWYNQSFYFKLSRSIEPALLRQYWLMIIQHHDILRLRIVDQGMAEVLPSVYSENSMCFRTAHNLDKDTTHQIIREMQAELDPRHGIISALGVFDIRGLGQHLFLSVHHTAIDLVSWQIILADLEALVDDTALLKKAPSFRAWAHHLSANHPLVGNAFTVPVMVDFGGYDQNTYGTSERLDITYPVDDLIGANVTYRTETVDLVLAALLIAWKKWTATDCLSILFESHGRFDDACDIDMSSTVGWFTNLYDLTLNIVGGSGAELVSHAIRTVKAERRQTGWRTNVYKSVPRRGNLTFNYATGFQELGKSGLFEMIELPAQGWQINPAMLRSSILDFTAVSDNKELSLGVLFNRNLHRKDSVANLIQLWQESLAMITEHCTAVSPTLTTSDVPLLQIDDHQLHSLLVDSSSIPLSVHEIETILPCTDMQSSLLLASQCSDSYIERLEYRLIGANLNVADLEKAWISVMHRHCLLRSIWIEKPRSQDLTRVLVILSCASPIISSSMQSSQNQQFEPGLPLSRVSFDISEPGIARMRWHVHHAIVDGWSTRIILQDFQQAYQGLPLTRSGNFVDYLKLYQSITFNTAHLSSFWKDYLAEVSPTKLIDPCTQYKATVTQPASYTLSQIADVSHSRLLHVCKLQGVTVSTLLRAALALTLSRYCHQDDICYGIVVSGRNAPIVGIENIAGPLINTQPFRIAIDPISRLSDLVRLADDRSRSLIAHEMESLRNVLRTIGRSSDLLQILLVYQNYPSLTPTSTDAMPFVLQKVDAVETTDVPLCIMAGTTPDNDALQLQAIAQTESFTASFTRNFLLSLSKTLQSFVDNIHQLCSDVDILHPVQAQMLLDWSGQTVQYERSPVALFEHVRRSASLFCEQIAVRELHTGLSITYQELLQKTQSLVAMLLFSGVKAHAVIAISMEKSINMIVAVLAVSQIGAYVPIDVDTPGSRKIKILEDSRASAILIDSGSAIYKEAQEFNVSVNLLDVGSLLEEAQNSSISPPNLCDPSGDDTAYILFTSGSTGRPKGVEIQHKAASTYVKNMKKSYGYMPGDTVFGFARLTFDISVTDIFSTLSAGATLCVVPQDFAMNDINAVLKNGHISSVNLTPTVASLLSPQAVPSLRTLILAGEAARSDIIHRWAPHAVVLNSSGPTEAAVTTVSQLLPDSDPRNVGKAVSGVSVFVLDQSLRQVPPGATGRVYFGGIQLARGYIRNEELTRRSFVENPHLPGTLMYDSGDLGAYDENGNLLHLGREDSQVKINGQRVELQEIEAVFNHDQSSGVEVVAAVIHKGTPQQKLIGLLCVSYELPSSTKALERLKESLVKRAAQYIPRYMIPTIWIPIDAVPRTSSGKIDRRALITRYETGTLSELSADPDSGTLRLAADDSRRLDRQVLSPPAQLLFQSLQEVLGDSANGLCASQDLFDHGLDSFNSMRLTSLLRRAVSDFQLQWIINGRTFDNIAATLENVYTAEMLTASQDAIARSNAIPPVVFFSQDPGVPYLFCIHPASGLGFQFAALSRATSSFNVVALNDPSFGQSDSSTDVEGNVMSSRAIGYYSRIAKILSIVESQHGTGSKQMNLMGYSFGGHLSVEVARLARRAGYHVNLFIIDSAVPNRRTPPTAVTKMQVDAVFNEFDIPEARISTEEYGVWSAQLRHQVERNLQALMRYKMDQYDGHIVLFRAEGNAGHGYAECVHSLEDIVIKGTHFELLDEKLGNIAVIVRKVSEVLEV